MKVKHANCDAVVMLGELGVVVRQQYSHGNRISGSAAG